MQHCFLQIGPLQIRMGKIAIPGLNLAHIGRGKIAALGVDRLHQRLAQISAAQIHLGCVCFLQSGAAQIGQIQMIELWQHAGRFSESGAMAEKLFAGAPSQIRPLIEVINARLEQHAKRVGYWKWRSNPFTGTRELNGLRVMLTTKGLESAFPGLAAEEKRKELLEDLDASITSVTNGKPNESTVRETKVRISECSPLPAMPSSMMPATSWPKRTQRVQWMQRVMSVAMSPGRIS